ncbi:MAG: hypothetical protein UMV23_02345, partial [Halanaerobium sp.]|nr:hypothetical protein [Halanaerobium sp.]
MNARIIGTGRYAPEKTYTVEEMSKLLGEDISGFMNPLGIEQRRQTGAKESTTDLAVQAASRAITSAKMKPEEIDLLILSTDTPDIISPPTAASVAYQLGMRDGAAFFDINVSCTGFVFASEMAKNWIKGNLDYENILIVSAYNM